MLIACSTTGEKWNPDDYTVKSGDTVFSIAWRYELDPEEFAAWNNLDSSDLIKAGQRLHTREPDNFVSSRKADSRYPEKDAYAPQGESGSKTPSNQSWVKVKKNDTLFHISRQHGVSVERLIQLNQLKKPYIIVPGQKIFLKPLQTTVSSSSQKIADDAKQTSSRTRPDKQLQSKSQKKFSWPGTVQWQRPATGKIVKKFDRRRNDAKGVDIAGKLGDTVVASASGKVVYSGDGLISYGKLIIIKHNETYLSAYAYNHKLLVKEGDIVKAGQKIATMGRKDRSTPQLHFEIRKNGKPVDPLRYLPS